MNQLATPSKLYSEYVFDGNESALQFWGPIPHNMKEANTISQSLINIYQASRQPCFTPERFAKLRMVIKDYHQTHQRLTPAVLENIELLEEQSAVIEAGHQPALFGGPGFVINKMAAITKLAGYQNSVPIMFVGDHDHEQKELTVVHFPSPGPRGINFSLNISHEFRQSPIHVIPLPSRKWLSQALEKIQSTYHELVIGSAKKKHKIYEEHVNQLLQIIEKTYNQSMTISDWTQQIWMQFINLSKDSGVLFQAFSNPRIQQLMFPAFEYLLSSPNRVRFVQALNQSADQLQKLGYQPGIGLRTDDYVPFHLECLSKGCNRTRLDPTLTTNRTQSTIIITAQCPKCKTTHSLETKSKTPDLTEWRGFLSPRVDTRAFLVQSYTPIIVHVGGAGETSYHAQVSPALTAINSVAPIFFRYSRLYYGNPWTRKQANKLTKEGLRPLQPSELQCFTASVNTGYQEENVGVISSLFAASEEHITETAEQLIQIEVNLEKERNAIIHQQRETEDDALKKGYQSKVGVLTRQRHVLQVYLSQMFGRYSAERLGQEASFSWIDAAISLGPSDLFPRLLAFYQPLTPASATFYLRD